ncbi:ATP-grasp domain-containing protein [bacterium]|nr:ATP-grasp domain-containing protein [bacterium]
MKTLRILLLLHEELIPPENATKKLSEGAPWKTEFDVFNGLKALGHDVLITGVHSNVDVLRTALFKHKPHIVFNLLEEFDGNATYDHNVVSYLELRRQAYTGCNPQGLMLARDKALSKKILSYHRIPTPKFAIIAKGHKVSLPKNLEYPVFVKSLIEEASLGISQASVVRSDKQLSDRVAFIHKSIGTDALIEHYIEGREFYIGVLGNKNLQTLPTYELQFNRLKDDSEPIATSQVKWSQKYRNKYGIRSVPARLNSELDAQIQKLAKRCYKRLGLSGYARIDLRVDNKNNAFILEANPNPGIAIFEEFPEAAKRLGYSYEECLSKIISLGLSWFEKRA